MPDWAPFAGLTAVLVVLLLALSRSSQRVLERTVVVDGDGDPKGDGAAEPAPTRQVPASGETGRPQESDEAAGPQGSNGATTQPAPSSSDRNTPERSGATARRERRGRRTGEADDGSSDDVLDDSPGVDVEGDTGGEVHEDSERGAVEDDGGRGVVETGSGRELTGGAGRTERPRITTLALLSNVVVSQGLFLGLLVAVAWWTDVPASAFGLAAGALTLEHVGYGLLAGLVIYAGNEVGAAASERFGFSAPKRLRRAMAPTDAAEWVLLLAVVLPVIAVFEELLFRGALIGVVHAGFGIDPWLLAAASSAVFGLGHGAQGRVGVLVTALLGFFLAALFVVTGSLLAVIVAHYAVNALEFGVREGLDWKPLAG